MTIEEFLSGKTLTAVEIVEDKILNLVLEGGTLKSLNVDTSQILAGTLLKRSEDFELTSSSLSCSGITINIKTTEVSNPKSKFDI